MASEYWWARTISVALRRLRRDPAVNKLATTRFEKGSNGLTSEMEARAISREDSGQLQA